MQSTLLDPVGFLSDQLDAEDSAAFSTRSSAAISSYASGSQFPSAQDAEWGNDKQYWVTVFGFPASAKSTILTQFQMMGEVVNFSAGSGNWLHVRYHTRLQAEKALSYDGQTLAGSIMIGVKKCYPAEVDGLREQPTSSLFVSPARQNAGSRYDAS